MALETILVYGVTEIIKRLLPVITEQITLAWGAKDNLAKLKEILESIQALITSAEEKQVNDDNVRLWLRRLKDVVYDAEDAMDKFSYETMRPREHNLRSLVSSSNPLLLRFKMACKIRTINEKLEEIFKNGERHQLQNTSTSNSQDNQIGHHLELIKKSNRVTSADEDDSILLEREGAKSEIIKVLIDKSSSSSSGISSQLQKLSILSIVGVGGMGKTTVAQMVYKDDSIVRNFEPRAWVCVSGTFNIYKILTDIIESITGKKCEVGSNSAKQVKENFLGRKYLLVLDDLWNEKVPYWEALKSYLICGGIGSKILITTRNRRFAFRTGGDVHDLKKLSSDVCWSIIKKKVLSRGGGVLTKKMTNIAKEIARKCGGLPLAVNSLGSLMCSRKDESYWLSIVNNISRLQGTPKHTRIIPILKLSYDNLPSPLKQCFSYCCIFPKDWKINREMLIRLWMAEGFLLPSTEGDDISLEEIGNEYFEYLLWSSFFQDVQKDKDSGDITTCKMHDLVRDLATSVQDHNEFIIEKLIDGKEEVSQVRRLELLSRHGRFCSRNVLWNAMKLRTIIVLKPQYFSHINTFSRFRRLRIICPLGGWHKCKLSCGDPKYCDTFCNSSSIYNLKHLRYLDLSSTNSRHEVHLNHFYNLQTLVLCGCINIPSCLLSNTGSLKSLRHLDISWSGIKSIPENIGSLKHLRFLDVSHTIITKLPDSVTCISNLRTFKFSWCENLDSLPRELGALTRIICLDLRGTSIKVLPESCITNLCNLEMVNLGENCELPKEIKNWPRLRIFKHKRKYDVMPGGIGRLTCLETLDCYTVGKRTQVVGSSSNNYGIEELACLHSLEVLTIRNLENMRGGKEGAERAKLKNKQHLKDLYLYWGSNREGDEEVRNNISVKDTTVLEGLEPHSNLKTLHIKGFSGLKLPKWMMGCSLSNCLPNLVEIHYQVISDCEKLPALGMLPYLRVLKMESMRSIKCLGEEFYYQQEEEEEESCSSTMNTTKRSSLFPSLRAFYISLENLQEWTSPSLSSYSCFPSLEILDIFHHQRLRITPPITLFSSLKKLKLSGTNDDVVNSLLNVRGGEGGLTSVTTIEIWNSPHLIYLPSLEVLLQQNSSSIVLQALHIRDCNNLRGFRDDDDYLNKTDSSSSNYTVESLILERCPLLASLPDFRLGNRIHSLQLLYCPALRSVPDLRLWNSLRELTIYGCGKLNKESIPYDLQKTPPFLSILKVDFIQKDEYSWGVSGSGVQELVNMVVRETE